MERKVLLATSLSAALMATAVGCGDAGGSERGKTELTYALWNPDQVPMTEELVSQFEAEHPDIDVSVQVTPFDQYFTKVQTAISGGAGPDVFWLNAPNLPLYASNGAVLPLADRLEGSEVSLDNYPEQLGELYTYEDDVYAIPRDFDTIGLWYNKELFGDAGVDYPTADWTWDDLESAAVEITDQAKGVYGITAWLTDQQGYYNTIPQAGGHVVSPDGTTSGYDDPKSVDGLRFWTDLIDRGVSPSHQEMTDTEPKAMFQSGESAMFYGGSWQAVSLAQTPDLAEKFDVAPLPAGPVSNTSVIHGLGNAINAKTDEPDAAWKLVEFLSSRESAEQMAASGVVIPAFSATQDAWVKAFPGYDLQVFLDAVDGATPFPVTANTAEWQLLEKEMLPAAWTGERAIEDVAKDLASAMNDVLSQQ